MRASLGGFLLDLRSTVRGLRKRPAFTAAAIATLAVGIGATTAVFSIVDAVLLRPLPYAEPERLVAIWPRQFVGNREIDFLRRQARSYDEVAGFSPGWLSALTEVDVPRQLNAARVTGNMFTMVGARALLGRPFGSEAEAPGTLAAVLGWDVWQNVFGGDRGIVGRSIVLNGSRYTVTAVMPRGFQLFDVESDLWIPLNMDPDEFTWSTSTGMAYGRLRPGATLQAAGAEAPALVRQMRDAFKHPADWGTDATVIALQEHVVGGVTRLLWILFGAVGFLLFIATTNVANLLLVRASERRVELAVRLSLGAPTTRVVRLLFTESVVVALAGGAIGVALAYATVRYFPALLPGDLPRLTEITVDGRVLSFALGATVVPAVLFGLAPLMQMRRRDTAAALRDANRGSRGGERTRGVLVAVEVAMATVLLVGATLMGRTLASLLDVDPGLRSDHLLTATVQPTGIGSSDRLKAFWRDVLSRVEGVPGVVSAGTILHLPTSGRSWSADIEVEGRPPTPGQSLPRSGWQSVSTKYFATAGVPVLEGRAFGDGDVAGAPRVAIINSAFAREHFRGESPVGRRIKGGNATNNDWVTIVGVVGSVRHDSLNVPPVSELYVPFEQSVVWATSLVVRTVGDPMALAGAVRDRVWSVSRNTPVTDMRPMADLLSASLHRPRLVLIVMSLFAGAGLLLGAVGIYGVVAYGVQQRVRELGIRAALGADAARLNTLVVRGGLRLTVVGVAAGVPLALGLSRFLRGFVYGVSPTDPLSFGVVLGTLVVVAVVASWVPARRASRADPMEVLRSE